MTHLSRRTALLSASAAALVLAAPLPLPAIAAPAAPIPEAAAAFDPLRAKLRLFLTSSTPDQIRRFADGIETEAEQRGLDPDWTLEFCSGLRLLAISIEQEG